MSHYTTEIRFICETESGLSESKGFNDINEILIKSAPKIFNFDFPIFDESYRLPLEIKILRHFYTREIGFETVGLWKLKLQSTLCDIMPYYNQLYKSQLLEFNPLYDVDLTIDHNKKGDTNSENENNSVSNGNNTSNAVSRNYYSDTPQGAVNVPFTKSGNGVSTTSDIGYLTNASKDDTSQTTHAETTSNDKGKFSGTTLEEYLEHIKGKRGTHTYSNMLLEYRKTFLNIDLSIIEELEPLFFGLWD